MRSRPELFVRFALVGVVGFAVDAGAISLLVRQWGVGPYEGRVGSFLLAATTTWWLNRRFTFGSVSPPFREFCKFLASNALGATLNLAVYAAIVAWRGASGWTPVGAVALGSLAGLSVNFLLSSKVVFTRRSAGAIE